MRQMIRDLKQEQYASKTTKDKVNGFSELSGSPDAAENEEIDTSESEVSDNSDDTEVSDEVEESEISEVME